MAANANHPPATEYTLQGKQSPHQTLHLPKESGIPRYTDTGYSTRCDALPPDRMASSRARP